MISRKSFSLRRAFEPRDLLGRLAGAGLLLVAIGGCSQAPPRPASAANEPAQAAREQALSAVRDWSFRGRIAVSHAGEGGSARIEWTQRGADYDIRLSAPVTRQSWRLRSDAGTARLEGLPDGPREGPDAEALLREATGWRLPVQALAAWTRGLRAPGDAQFESDPAGLPAVLRQHDWTVEYRGWTTDSPALPTRVFARTGDASVRLVVEDWAAP
jgi:outer membrane lipoprotein LolB